MAALTTVSLGGVGPRGVARDGSVTFGARLIGTTLGARPVRARVGDPSGNGEARLGKSMRWALPITAFVDLPKRLPMTDAKRPSAHKRGKSVSCCSDHVAAVIGSDAPIASPIAREEQPVRPHGPYAANAGSSGQVAALTRNHAASSVCVLMEQFDVSL